ncbi:hypothetical protein LTS12_029413, partial [Elasticomyces elasticus]
PSDAQQTNIHENEADVPAQSQPSDLTLSILKEPEQPEQNGSGHANDDDHGAAVPEQQLDEGNAA